MKGEGVRVEPSKIPSLLDHVVSFKRQKSSPVSGNASHDSSLTLPSNSSDDGSSCSDSSSDDSSCDSGAERNPWDIDADSIYNNDEWAGVPTPLFESIEKSDWISVVAFLKSDNWSWNLGGLLCESFYDIKDRGGASAQARTWVRFSDDLEGEICRLPLHAALLNRAPYEVIQLLLQHYKKSVEFADSDGNFPLHLAFQANVPLPILVLILKEYPRAVSQKNKHGMLPDECGKGNAVGDVLRICIDETKASMINNNNVGMEPGALNKQQQQMQFMDTNSPIEVEAERNLLIEVTKELIDLKERVSEVNGADMIKEKIILNRNQLAKAISDLSGLMTDLEYLEEGIFNHHPINEEENSNSKGKKGLKSLNFTSFTKPNSSTNLYDTYSQDDKQKSGSQRSLGRKGKSIISKARSASSKLLRKNGGNGNGSRSSQQDVFSDGDRIDDSTVTGSGITVPSPRGPEDDSVNSGITEEDISVPTKEDIERLLAGKQEEGKQRSSKSPKGLLIKIKDIVDSVDGIELTADLNEHEKMLLQKSLDQEREKTEKILSELFRVKEELEVVKEKEKERRKDLEEKNKKKYSGKKVISRIRSIKSNMRHRRDSKKSDLNVESTETAESIRNISEKIGKISVELISIHESEQDDATEAGMESMAMILTPQEVATSGGNVSSAIMLSNSFMVEDEVKDSVGNDGEVEIFVGF